MGDSEIAQRGGESEKSATAIASFPALGADYSHITPLCLYAKRPIYFGLSGQQLLEFTALVHLRHDVRTPDEFTLDVELRDGRPLGVFLDALADIHNEFEYDLAKGVGVRGLFSAAPVAIVGNGKAEGVEFRKTEVVDGQVREIAGSEFVVPCDLVILATGQEKQKSLLSQIKGQLFAA